MSNFKFYIFAFFCIISLQSYSQKRKCLTNEYNNIILKDNNYNLKNSANENYILNWIKNNKNYSSKETIKIPVVVHVVYKNEEQNISDEQIISQIEVLNNDFRRLNKDTTNTPDEFKDLGANCNIEFLLAKQDTNGNYTNGITRTATRIGSFSGNNNVKYTSDGGCDSWNSDYYLNIWICNLDDNIIGYSQFPGIGLKETDGVVMSYKYFGTIGTVQYPFNLGRSCTHEVGHWFNLKHIWGDDNGSCSGSDLVYDTPNQASEYYDCPSYPQSSCESNNMFMNYMDYTNDECMNIFTKGQKDRIDATINVLRNNILTSPAQFEPEINEPIAKMQANANHILKGTSVKFNNVLKEKIDSIKWIFNGAEIQKYTINSPKVAYQTTGEYDITLIVKNEKGIDTTEYENFIKVDDKPQNENWLNYPVYGEMSNITAGVGYVGGTNSFNDIAKANYFSNNSYYNIMYGVNYIFNNINCNEDIVLSIWDNSGSGGLPGKEILRKSFTSNEISNDIKNKNFTYWKFDEPMDFNAPIYIGYYLPQNNNDSISLLSIINKNSSDNKAFEQHTNELWFSCNSSYSWGLNLSFAIFPNVGIAEEIAIFPNPIKDFLNIAVDKQINIDKIIIEIYNTYGKKVFYYNTENIEDNSIKLNLNTLNSGLYIMKIKVNEEYHFRKFIKIKE